MTWRPSKSLRECSGINRRNTVSCFVIHKYGNGKQRLLVPADPCASSQITQSQRVHTKERRTKLWSWGDNSDGQLGLGNIVNRSSPVQVGALTTWQSVAATAGGEWPVAQRTDGSVWTWGRNFQGELGLGDI